MQREVVCQALSLFETAKTPRTTVKSPFSWKEDGVVWRARYGRVDPIEKDRLPKVGEERRRQQAMARCSPNVQPPKNKPPPRTVAVNQGRAEQKRLAGK